MTFLRSFENVSPGLMKNPVGFRISWVQRKL